MSGFHLRRSPFPFTDNSNITVDGTGAVRAFHEVIHTGTESKLRLDQDVDGALHVVGTHKDGAKFIDITVREGPTGATNE